jgi:hypothetical protein
MDAVEKATSAVPVITFLMATVDKPRLGAVFAQVVNHVARRLEAVLAKAQRGLQEGGDVNLAFTAKGIVPGSKDMEEKLYQYVLASCHASMDFDIMSLCTDKASPAGMHLQNSAIVYGNNVAVLCCPVVPSRSVELPKPQPFQFTEDNQRVDIPSVGPTPLDTFFQGPGGG